MPIPGLFSQRSPHKQYADRLQQAGLARFALGRQWMDAAEQSLAHALEVKLPYREQGFFSATVPKAAGLQIKVKNGQQLVLHIDMKPDTGAQLFAELWELRGNGKLRFITAADSAHHLRYEPDDEMTLIVRIQPELLTSVSYTLSLFVEPVLAFPVPGHDGKGIGSFWGDARDAGKRRHEGVDIFDRFRTPVVAASAGMVSAVNENKLGGKAVWLRPSGKNYLLYYAHLDSQIARPWQQVNRGDTLGLMGNTGNAKHTPTHVHFGIYTMYGAVDPLPFIQQVSKVPEKTMGEPPLARTAMRTNGRQQLQNNTEKHPAQSTALEPNTFVWIDASAGRFYKVSLPDGSSGFMAANGLDETKTAVKNGVATDSIALLEQPAGSAAVIDAVPASATVQVHAYFGSFAYISYRDAMGWVPQEKIGKTPTGKSGSRH